MRYLSEFFFIFYCLALSCQFLMRYLSEVFLRHYWDIGSLVFTLLGWAYILTFEFLCAGLSFETSDLVTFCLSEGQLLSPSGLVLSVLVVCIMIMLHVCTFVYGLAQVPSSWLSLYPNQSRRFPKEVGWHIAALSCQSPHLSCGHIPHEGRV